MCPSTGWSATGTPSTTMADHDRAGAGRHLRDLRAPTADPPLVLVPGIDGTALLFYRQVPLLARFFDVVAFPLPTLVPMTMEALADDLAALVREVSGSGAILCGESFGGALALSTALRHPGLVRGLVIVNSFPYLDTRRRLAVAPRLLRAMPWGAMRLVRRATSSRLHSPHARPEDLREFRRRAEAIDRDGYIGRLEVIRRLDLRHRLADIAAPTLLLAGDLDRLVPSVRWARYMHERITGSTLGVLEGYGHVCLINHDLDLADHVVPWWRAVGAQNPDPNPVPAPAAPGR